VSFLALTITPALTIYGLFNVNWNTKTAIWSVLYYFVTGLGITAGYHVRPVPAYKSATRVKLTL
jgi:stearoyl-CoA desaturase (delta-9 desaturase)